MKKFFAAFLLSAGLVTLGPGAILLSSASSSIPPVCVHKHPAGVNVQVGYCP